MRAICVIALLNGACISFEPTLDATTRVTLSGVSGDTGGSGSVDTSTGPTGPSGATSSSGDTGASGGTGASGVTGPSGPVLSTLGVSCSAGPECASGICADGVCCDEPCTDSCVRCDSVGGTAGSCHKVSTTPIVPHLACNTLDATCAGACTGMQRQCVYPDATTRCGTNCDGACSSDGTCTAVGACPNGFACQGTSCASSCASGADCAANFECVAPPTCTRVPESDCLNGADDNGDGLADCQDPTCLGTQVECVDNPAAAAALGYVEDSVTACDAAYATSTPMHQGPVNTSNNCSGCSCATNAYCYIYLKFYTRPIHDCSGTEAAATLMRVDRIPSGGFPTCADSFDINSYSGIDVVESGAMRPGSIKYDSVFSGPNSVTCTHTGSPSKPGRTWTTDGKFCAAQAQTPTCTGNQVCLPKRSVTRCVRLTNPADPCPSPYTVSATWSSAFATDTRSCNTCSTGSCTAATTMSCPTSWSLSADDDADPGTAGLQQCSPLGSRYPVTPNTVFWDCTDSTLVMGQCQTSGCYNSFTSLTQSSAGSWGTDNCSVIQPTVIGSPAGDNAFKICCTP